MDAKNILLDPASPPARRLSCAVVGLSPDDAEAVRLVLDGHARILVQEGGLETEGRRLSTMGVRLVLLGVDQDPERAFHLARRLDQEHGLKVVALGDTREVGRLKAALRAGCFQMVDPWREHDLLRNTVRELEQVVNAEGRRPGSLIAVIGCRGGIGCTSIALSLAEQIAADPECRVVLTDLDQGGGDMLGAVNVLGGSTTHDLVVAMHRLDPEAIRGSLAQHPRGFWILPQPEEELESVSMVEQDVEVLTHALCNTFDRVVLDLGSRLTEPGRMACADANRVVLVADQDIRSLRTARRRLKLLKELGLDDDRIHLVLSRFSPKSEFSVELVENELRHPVDTTLAPDTGSMEASQRQGRPVTEVAPSSALARDLKDLASRVEGRVPAPRKRSWWLMG